jgi:hypothetical protein
MHSRSYTGIGGAKTGISGGTRKGGDLPRRSGVEARNNAVFREIGGALGRGCVAVKKKGRHPKVTPDPQLFARPAGAGLRGYHRKGNYMPLL